jgi:outer membrane protein
MLARLPHIPALVCSALLFVCHVAAAQTKVGVINLQRAVFESAEIKKANDQMQATFKPRQDKIEQLQKELSGIAQQLQSSGGKLTPQAESDLQAQGTKKQRELQRLQEDLQNDVQNYRNDILTRSSTKMTDVVKKLAEAKGLDLVVDSSTALYFKDALDLTNDAIASYDKAYPAK